MKAISFFLKLIRNKHVNIYRIITALGFISAVTLIMMWYCILPDPDDSANYVGVKHFSEGRFMIDYDTILDDVKELSNSKWKGVLIQYMPLDNGMWALEKAPGYIFYLVPFFKLGIPRFGNIALALGMTIVTYMLLKRLRDEKAAMIGSLLMLYTPVSLMMLNRAFMDTYFSMAMLVIGSGLYYYHHLEKDKMGAKRSRLMLFMAFLFISWSVVGRYSNVLIAATLAFHYAIVRFKDRRQGNGSWFKAEITPVILGIGIPLAALLIYNYFIFGSPLKTGYSLSPYPIRFAFQYIGQIDNFGKSIPGQILLYNAENFLKNIFIGFPVLLIGIPAYILVLYRKIAGCFKNSAATGTWSNIHKEISWDLFIILTAWFIFVFVLYWCYEFTTIIGKGGLSVAIVCRLLLPGLFPVVIISAIVLARLRWWIYVPITTILVAAGITFYLQWLHFLFILPSWVTDWSKVKGRWENYTFPPWCKTPDEIGPKYYPWYYYMNK